MMRDADVEVMLSCIEADGGDDLILTGCANSRCLNGVAY